MTTLISPTYPTKQHSGTSPVQERSAEQHFVLSNVAWQDYVAIGKALADRGGLRITYDSGNIELMTTSSLHELLKKWFGRLVETIAEELNRPIAPRGNMTFQREDLAKGIEGDECYWIVHEAQMRRNTHWDPDVDPPPDLFLEIEVSRNILNRLSICARLRIPEVWRFDGERITVHRLQPDGTYLIVNQSQFFPEIPVQEIVRFVMREDVDYLTVVQEFRAWLRQILGKPLLT